MPYWIKKFGTINLPDYEPIDDIGLEARLFVHDLPGGWVFDSLGDDVALRISKSLSVKRRMIYADYSILKPIYDSWLSTVGKRDKLWRVDNSNNYQWTYARLAQLNATRLSKDHSSLDVEFVFRILSPCWYSENSTTIILNTSPKTVTNNGNKSQTRMQFRIYIPVAGSTSAITITNSTTGHQIKYNGSLATYDTLVIDTGAMTVIKNSTIDAYADFVPPDDKEEWFKLVSGNNSITRSVSGSGYVIELEYYHSYA